MWYIRGEGRKDTRDCREEKRRRGKVGGRGGGENVGNVRGKRSSLVPRPFPSGN